MIITNQTLLMKNVLTFCCLFLLTTLSAQLAPITLEDAILQRFGKFYPTSLSDLQFIPETDRMVYTAADRKAFLVNQNGKIDTILTLETLNKNAQCTLKRMPNVTWVDADRFYFHHDTAFIAYDFDEQRGFVLTAHPAAAANLDFNYQHNHLAYTMDNDLYTATIGISQTTVVDNTDRNVVSGQAIARYEFGIGKGTFWSPNGRLLAFYEKDETNVADYPILDITSTPGRLKEIKYPMAGQPSEHGRVGVYDRNTKRTIYLQVTGPKDQYVTNLGWGPASKNIYIAVVNRDQNRMWLNQYDAQTGNFVKTLFEEKHDKYVEPENPVWFLPNNNQEFLWMSERDGFMHVYRYNAQGQLLNQVTKGKLVVLSILGLDDSGKKLIVTGTDESGLNQYAYTVNLDGTELRQIPAEPGVHRYKLNAKGNQLIDQYTNLETPNVINLIDLNGKVLQNLHTADNPMEKFVQPVIELLEIESPAGMTLNARMIKPSHFNDTLQYPVLVYVYGGPHAQMVTNRWGAGAPTWMLHAAEKGFIIFTVDNRGSANRGFDFENAIHRQLGKVEMEDQLAGVAYLKSLPYVNADRMAVHGWSYGGFMTTSLMLRHPDVFKVGVAGGPVTDWKFYEVMYGERYMDRPEENEDGYANNRLSKYVSDLKGDLLLIHGTVDDVVVMQHSLDLIKAFVDAGIQVDFFPYPMHPHNVRGKDRVHLMDKVIRYIERSFAELDCGKMKDKQ